PTPENIWFPHSAALYWPPDRSHSWGVASHPTIHRAFDSEEPLGTSQSRRSRCRRVAAAPRNLRPARPSVAIANSRAERRSPRYRAGSAAGGRQKTSRVRAAARRIVSLLAADRHDEPGARLLEAAEAASSSRLRRRRPRLHFAVGRPGQPALAAMGPGTRPLLA